VIRRRRWRLMVLLALLSSASVLVAQPQLQRDGMSSAQVQASEQLLAAGWARLTPRWRQALPATITLQWSDRLPAHVHGRAIRQQLLLDRRLLDGWMQAPAQDDDPARRAALAALLHELGHFLDRRLHLSNDPQLLDLAGWQRQPWRPWRGSNHFSDRSPDRYELAAPREFVAVNLEHFLLDADYACRRPALAAWFSARLGAPPMTADCDATLPYLQADSEDGDVSPLLLDPARIYAVDYLLAEGNEQVASRWGHSMLRLVICAPGRPLGPDCRLDLRYHRVLSFRAFVGDVQISSWRGLTGSYPSRLFVLPLTQVVDEYTKVELRGLASVPLRLQPQEIVSLMQRAARVHWSYDGHYYFIGNNCAVETWKLLHDGIARMAALPLSGITPRGLLRRLQRHAVADTSVLLDHAEAVRRGYYFESAAAHYQAMFEVLRQSLQLPQREVEQWLALSPSARRQWMGNADMRTSAALLLLEQAAQRRQELRIREIVKRRLLSGRGEHTSEQLAALQQLMATAGGLARPAALLSTQGYGLPQDAELHQLSATSQQRSQQLRQGWQALREWTRAGLPEAQRGNLAGIEANLAFIGERLRSLNAQSGGLILPSVSDDAGKPQPVLPSAGH
jgi:hypothetical protein